MKPKMEWHKLQIAESEVKDRKIMGEGLKERQNYFFSRVRLNGTSEKNSIDS